MRDLSTTLVLGKSVLREVMDVAFGALGGIGAVMRERPWILNSRTAGVEEDGPRGAVGGGSDVEVEAEFGAVGAADVGGGGGISLVSVSFLREERC